MSGEECEESVDGSYNTQEDAPSFDPFNSPSGGQIFSPDAFDGANRGLLDQLDSSGQDSFSKTEVFGLITAEDLRADHSPGHENSEAINEDIFANPINPFSPANGEPSIDMFAQQGESGLLGTEDLNDDTGDKSRSPIMFSSQSASPSPDADATHGWIPDNERSLVHRLNEAGEDSGFISPATTTQTVPQGQIQLVEELLQMSNDQSCPSPEVDHSEENGECCIQGHHLFLDRN